MHMVSPRTVTKEITQNVYGRKSLKEVKGYIRN